MMFVWLTHQALNSKHPGVTSKLFVAENERLSGCTTPAASSLTVRIFSPVLSYT